MEIVMIPESTIEIVDGPGLFEIQHSLNVSIADILLGDGRRRDDYGLSFTLKDNMRIRDRRLDVFGITSLEITLLERGRKGLNILATAFIGCNVLVRIRYDTKRRIGTLIIPEDE
jgi:hypothetical protein